MSDKKSLGRYVVEETPESVYELDGELASPYVILDTHYQGDDLGRYYYNDADLLDKFETQEETQNKCDKLNEECNSKEKTYIVEIVETLTKKVRVKATSLEEAETIAVENYHNEEEGYVLDATNHADTEFYVSQNLFVNG